MFSILSSILRESLSKVYEVNGLSISQNCVYTNLYNTKFLMHDKKGCASWKMKFWKSLKTLKNYILRPKNVIFERFQPLSKFHYSAYTTLGMCRSTRRNTFFKWGGQKLPKAPISSVNPFKIPTQRSRSCKMDSYLIIELLIPFAEWIIEQGEESRCMLDAKVFGLINKPPRPPITPPFKRGVDGR